MVYGAIYVFVIRHIHAKHETFRLQLAEGEQILETLPNLSPEDVETIVIHDRYGRKVLATVADEVKKAGFLSAVSQMKDWTPNHPSFKKHYRIVLETTQSGNYEFELCLKSPPDTTVYVDGVRVEGDTTYYLYSKKSDVLKAWLDSALSSN